MISYCLSTSDEELKQILALQKSNLLVSVSEEDQKTEGFVTVQHNFDLLKAMHNKCPHILAKDGNKVVGYALSMHPIFGEHIEVLKPMFERLRLRSTCTKFVVMGQICIDKSYRKQGIFRSLYKTMGEQLLPQFSEIITEVDAKNTRSIQAHYAVGFKDLGRYTAEGQEWILISLK